MPALPVKIMTDRFIKIFKKYWTIINITFQRGLTYRFTVFSYRVGEILENLVLILMWLSIFKGQTLIQGYTINEMITYVIIGSLISLLVRNWLSEVVSSDIKEGRLSMQILKPMSYAKYVFSREIGRVGLPFIMSVASQLIFLSFFLNKLIFNSSLMYLGVIVIMIILAFITELLLSYLVGLIAFWTVEVDGINHTFYRVKRFFSGGYFPLSLLPVVYVKISYLLPFAYSFFVPTQLYLKKIDLLAGIKGLGVQIIWIVILYIIIKIVWNRGLKKYEGVGI